MSSQVSIVMLCWNRKQDVEESLLNIRNINYPYYEIIVVDNASTDGTSEMIQHQFPEVKLITLDKNIGIAAYNLGFMQAKGEYTVIIDDDSFPAPNALTLMVEKFKNNSKLGAVAFDVRNFFHYDEISRLDIDRINTVAASTQYLMGFNGAGVGIRSSLFRKVGYYPEEFFLYNNELDTAYRIWDSGYSIEFHADVVSYHKYSPVNRASARAPFYYTRNAFWTIWKNFPVDMAIMATCKLSFMCFFSSAEQKTPIYLNALSDALLNIHLLKGKRQAVKREIAEKIRFPYDTFFTFYR